MAKFKILVLALGIVAGGYVAALPFQRDPSDKPSRPALATRNAPAEPPLSLRGAEPKSDASAATPALNWTLRPVGAEETDHEVPQALAVQGKPAPAATRTPRPAVVQRSTASPSAHPIPRIESRFPETAAETETTAAPSRVRLLGILPLTDGDAVGDDEAVDSSGS